MENGQLDAAPIWSDLKSFPWAEFRDRVDILSGGYPCQPFSAAGKRLGTDDPQHLWPHIASGIRLLRPKLCFFENVEGHISLGLREVIEDLEYLGYEATWGIFSAAECGAPHQRKRVFILAVSSGLGGAARISGSLTGHEGIAGVVDDRGGQTWPSRPGQPQHAWEPPRVVCNTSMFDGAGQAGGQWETQTGRTGATQHEWETQPALGRNFNESSSGLDYAELCVSCDNRTDELRLLGNGVVPATAAKAFTTLLQQLL